MSEGKEEVDLEQQQCQEMESRWWTDQDRIGKCMKGWYTLWGNTGGWSLKASDPQCSEMGSSPAVSTTDHTVEVAGTDPVASEEAGRG